jgi:tripartite-type tricarboxylate transporter receptor subunit TctC
MRFALLIALHVAWSAAHAQTYPIKPIRVLLAFAGGTDVVARLLATKMSPAIGQQLVTEPRLGAGQPRARGGGKGAARRLHAADGGAAARHQSASQQGELRSAARLRAGGGADRELIQRARSAPGKLTYGSGGVGSSNHLAGELLKSVTATQIVHVPYKSATIALTGAMGGEVDIVIVAASSVVNLVKDGRMRALAVLDAKRIASIPDVPTASEAGVPQVVIVNWSCCSRRRALRARSSIG